MSYLGRIHVKWVAAWETFCSLLPQCDELRNRAMRT